MSETKRKRSRRRREIPFRECEQALASQLTPKISGAVVLSFSQSRMPRGNTVALRRKLRLASWVRFALDSPLEGDEFELLVPRHERRGFLYIPGIAGGTGE